MIAVKRGLARRIAILTISTVVVFMVFVISSYFFMNQANRKINQQIENQLKTREEVEQLREQYTLTALAFRGYIAFERDQFLAETRQHQASFDKLLESVKSKVKESDWSQAERQRTLDVLTTDWNQYLQFLDEGKRLRQTDHIQQILELQKERGTPTLQRLMKSLDDLHSSYELELKQLLAKQKEYEKWLQAIPFIILLGAGATAAYVTRFMRKSIVDPLLALEEAVNRISNGEYILLPETGREDELGTLEKGINNMSRQLEQRYVELEENYEEMISQRDQLESQNEEIIAQQLEQEATLQKLTERERELEYINSFQETLTGYAEMSVFLQRSVTALLQVIEQDAAVIVVKDPNESGNFLVLYSAGYPENHFPRKEKELFGSAERIFREKEPITRLRPLTEKERGIHAGYENALDQYYPLMNENNEVNGFILLTNYHVNQVDEKKARLIRGLVKQFSLALYAQWINEVRRKQSEKLASLNKILREDQKVLQEQKDLINRILESSHEGMVMCDDQGSILFANQRLVTFFNMKDFVGRKLSAVCEEIFPCSMPSSPGICEKIEAYMSGKLEALNERIQVQREDEYTTYYELYANTVVDEVTGRTRGFLFVFRDRTEEAKVDEMKNEFVSIVSHELRTPLATVLGFMEILLNRDITKEKQKKYMETIYKEANRLSNLINDFLDLQRMESGKQMYQMAPVHLDKVLHDVVEQWQGKQNHQIHMRIPDREILIHADVDRMTQVFHNLISNAIKYSPQATVVEVEVEVNDRSVYVHIQDYGLGIPEENKAMLFSKFYRVDNSDRRQIGGTGLGLAIVKEIVEAHRGQVSFTSELGVGSRFTIQLELYELSSLEGKILILEDDESLSRLIAEALEKLNLPIVQMRSAEEALLALERVRSAPPQLCIVDIQLQGAKSGWDFITELKRHQAYFETPVIVSTVLEQPLHYYENETEKYMKKPFSIDWMMEVAIELLHSRREKPAFVFPRQDESRITDSLEQNGMEVTEVKVKHDFIEVDVKERGRAQQSSY